MLQFGYRLAEREGSFGLGQRLAGVLDKAVSLCFDEVAEEHGLTEDAKPWHPTYEAIPSETACYESVVGNGLTFGLQNKAVVGQKEINVRIGQGKSPCSTASATC